MFESFLHKPMCDVITNLQKMSQKVNCAHPPLIYLLKKRDREYRKELTFYWRLKSSKYGIKMCTN